MNKFKFISGNIISEIPPWIFPEPKVNIDITEKKK